MLRRVLLSWAAIVLAGTMLVACSNGSDGDEIERLRGEAYELYEQVEALTEENEALRYRIQTLEEKLDAWQDGYYTTDAFVPYDIY